MHIDILPVAMGEELQVPEDYAESLMVSAISEDGLTDLSIRLARFPKTGKADVWFHLATPKGAWSVVDRDFLTETSSVTPVELSEITFSAGYGAQRVSFRSFDRLKDRMSGHVEGSILASRTRDPETGRGSIPVTFELDFDARSGGYRSKTGRWELTGNIRGSVCLNGEKTRLNEPGKWHEQTGVRKKFSPAFTYFNVQNSDKSILAIEFARRVIGYALIDNILKDVVGFSIQPGGSAHREFSIEIDGHQQISGVATEVQHWSVPVEGIRRSGSTVKVISNIGMLIGTVNDWQPPAIKPLWKEP